MTKFYFFLFLFLSASWKGVAFSGTGSLTVVSAGGDALNSTWTYSGGVLSTLSATASVNASVIEGYLATGDLQIEAGTIALNASISNSTANTLVLKSIGNITTLNTSTLTTQGGSLVFWSDTDGDGNGYVGINSSITTNGGGIWIGGSYGTNNSGATSWIPYSAASAIPVGDGYSPSGGGSNEYGVKIDADAAIQTGGGNITIYGYGNDYFDAGSSRFVGGVSIVGGSLSSSGGNIDIEGEAISVGVLTIDAEYAVGILIHSGASILSASGNLNIQGALALSDYEYASAVWIGSKMVGSTTGSVTISSTTGTLHIVGNSQNSVARNSYKNGIVFQTTGSVGDNINITSTSGNILVEGTAGLASEQRVNVGLKISSGDADSKINITSVSGPITLKGVNRGNEGASQVAIEFNAANASNQIRIGFDGTTPYVGDILIQANSIKQTASQSGTGTMSFQTTGSLAIEPVDNAFTNLNLANVDGNLVFDNDWNFGTSISNFRIGKSTNTKDLTIGQSLSAAGEISLYGTNITINQNLSSSSGGNLSFWGNTLTIANGITLSSSGTLQMAPITSSNSIGLAGATGDLSIPSTYFTSNFVNGFSKIIIGGINQTGDITMNATSLQDPLELITSGNLTLGGKVQIGNDNLILSNQIASVITGSSAYFQTNGTGSVVRRIGNGSTSLLPVGNASYNPVTIFNNTGTDDDFSARVVDAVLDGGTTGTALTDKVVKRTWELSKALPNGGSGVNMTFEWTSTEEGTNITDYKLSHFGTYWAPAVGTSGSIVDNGTTKTLTHTGYTGSFSPFAIGSTGGALPVNWLDFSARENGFFVELEWHTASEQNSRDFVVQHRHGSGAWNNIGTIGAAGNSSQPKSYRYIHAQPLKGWNDYRLLQRDQDNKESFSKVVRVHVSSNTPTAVYPIPTMNGKLFVNVPSDQRIHVFNLSGKQVLSQQVKTGVQLLDVTTLSKGIYFLRMNDEMVRFIIQ